MSKTDGSIDIQLSKPINVGGAPVGALRMREPTVADQLAMDKIDGGPAEKEIAIFAMLCMVAPADLHQLTLRDYRKVSKAFESFLS